MQGTKHLDTSIWQIAVWYKFAEISDDPKEWIRRNVGTNTRLRRGKKILIRSIRNSKLANVIVEYTSYTSAPNVNSKLRPLTPAVQSLSL